MDNEKIIILKEDGSPDKKAMFWSKAKEVMKDIGAKTKEIAKDSFQFVKENKETIAFLVPIVAGISAKVAGKPKVGKSYREDDLFYDRATGSYWQLKRRMSNSEMQEFLERREAGERPQDILRSMRILK
jgi:hypothetical protein